MTGEEITCIHAAFDAVGRIVEANGALTCEGILRGGLEKDAAAKELAAAWNELPALLREVEDLAEDHARMTKTLRTIAGMTADALQGTARSQIAADWWQAGLAGQADR